MSGGFVTTRWINKITEKLWGRLKKNPFKNEVDFLKLITIPLKYYTL